MPTWVWTAPTFTFVFFAEKNSGVAIQLYDMHVSLVNIYSLCSVSAKSYNVPLQVVQGV